jgi:hypothetical protein
MANFAFWIDYPDGRSFAGEGYDSARAALMAAINNIPRDDEMYDVDIRTPQGSVKEIITTGYTFHKPGFGTRLGE